MTNSKRMLKSVQSSVWLSFSIITSIIKVIVVGILLFELNHLLAIVVLILSIPCLIFKRKMKKIEDCIHCGQCSAHCPYGLDTPTLLEENYKDYKEVLAGKKI